MRQSYFVILKPDLITKASSLNYRDICQLGTFCASGTARLTSATKQTASLRPSVNDALCLVFNQATFRSEITSRLCASKYIIAVNITLIMQSFVAN